jgi:hypothetical protein
MKQKFFSKKFLAKVFVVQVFCLGFLVFVPTVVYGGTYTLKVPLPSMATIEINAFGTAIATYISAWYKFVIATIGVLATVMIMAGGFIWLTAGGNQSQISTAKDWITGAFAGMVIALLSYTVLEILNPSLVNFKPLAITPVIKEDVEFSGICCYKTLGTTSPVGKDGKCIDGVTTKCTVNQACIAGEGCVDKSKEGCCKITYLKQTASSTGLGTKTIECNTVMTEDVCKNKSNQVVGVVQSVEYKMYQNQAKFCINVFPEECK